MRKQNIKHISSVKQAVAFLNKNFPSADNNPKFIAFLPPDNSTIDPKMWHIVTQDWFLYNGKHEDSEDVRICIEAIRQKFKELKFVFCYQYFLTSTIAKNYYGYILVK